MSNNIKALDYWYVVLLDFLLFTILYLQYPEIFQMALFYFFFENQMRRNTYKTFSEFHLVVIGEKSIYITNDIKYHTL